MTAHPDKGGSEAKMANVNEAYEVLSKPGSKYHSFDPLFASLLNYYFQISDAASTLAKIRMTRWLEQEAAASRADIHLRSSSNRGRVGLGDSSSITATDIK